MEVSIDELRVKIHFDGWSEQWDEWIEINSERLAQFNSVIRRNSQVVS